MNFTKNEIAIVSKGNKYFLVVPFMKDAIESYPTYEEAALFVDGYLKIGSSTEKSYSEGRLYRELLEEETKEKMYA